MILIFSSVGPIIVDGVKGKDRLVFITGEVSIELIRTLAKMFEVEFDADQDNGIFITVLRSPQ